MTTPIVEGNEAVVETTDRREPAQKPVPQRKLPRTHYAVLSRMAASPGNPLRRLSGGFWVVDPDADEYQEGEWHASTAEVTGMLRHGFVQHVALGSSAVELTPVGIEALRTERYTPLK